MSKYPEACIIDLFNLVSNGVSWKKITKRLNKKYKFVNDETHYRNLYHRNKAKFDLSENEKLTVDLLREAANARKNATKRRAETNLILNELNVREHIEAEVDKVLAKYEKTANTIIKPPEKVKKNKKLRSMTMALDISDVHGGLATDKYHYGTIRKRLNQLVDVFKSEYIKNSHGWNVDDFVISFNGDVIHSDTLHEESHKTCEESTPGQIFSTTDLLFDCVMAPLAEMGIPIRVVATPGNHDRTTKSRATYRQGKEAYSWVVYKTLEKLCSLKGYKHIEWHIAEDYGVVINIQGSNILYEHGDMIKAFTKDGLINHLNKRQTQCKIILHGLRVGHIHEFMQLGRKIIVNGALTCGDSYSDSLGFDTEAVQTIVTYCQTNNRENTLYKVFPVQLT